MPTSVQAGFYSATLAYLNAVKAAGTDDADKVMATLKSTKWDDPVFGPSYVRADGRKMHDMYLFEVKTPAESKGPWDYYKLLATIPARTGLPAARPGQLPAWSRSRTEKETIMAEPSNIYAGVAGYFGKPDHPGKFGVFQRAANGRRLEARAGQRPRPTRSSCIPNPEIVFAGTNDGVWRSTDRGATFKRADFPDAKKQVWCFMVDSRDPKKMLAGASPIDVYRSDDGGATGASCRRPRCRSIARDRSPRASCASRSIRRSRTRSSPRSRSTA